MIRKIYSGIAEVNKNVKWRSLTNKELDKSMNDLQIFHNCFDEATRYSLLSSTKGRDLLKKRLKIQKGDGPNKAYKIILNIKGKNEAYRATEKDYIGKYKTIYDTYNQSIPKNQKDFEPRLSTGVGIAISKMLKKHFFQKPFISRVHALADNSSCEYNKPSNAFKWFTGIAPVIIGETSLKSNLKSHKKQVITTLKELGNTTDKHYSFIVLSGFKSNSIGPSLHCYSLTNVNNKKQEVTLLNRRTNKTCVMKFNDLIKEFKALVGINWNSKTK